MALKRKRSNDFNDSSPASINYASSYLHRSSQSPSPIPYPSFEQGSALPQWPHPQDQRSPHSPGVSQTLNSRTRKRWRDLRPDVETIHAQTMQKLYNAQQLYPHASPVPSLTAPLCDPDLQQPVQKTSLHSFWNLPEARPPVSRQLITGPTSFPNENGHLHKVERCEDCDSPLNVRNEDQDVMVLDYGDITPLASMKCGSCGRKICDFCAVAKENRVCLECATEGGI